MNKIINKVMLIMFIVGAVIYLLAILGCSTPMQPKMYDLLYEDEYKNYAYKSVTKKDYDDPPMEGA